MRPGKFLKRLIKPISDEAVDAALAEREAAKKAESTFEPPVNELPAVELEEREPERVEDDPAVEVREQEQTPHVDSPDRMFASDEELREAGIDPSVLYPADTSSPEIESEVETAEDSVEDEPELTTEVESEESFDPEVDPVVEPEPADEPVEDEPEQLDEVDDEDLVDSELDPIVGTELDDEPVESEIDLAEEELDDNLPEPEPEPEPVGADERSLAQSAVNAGFVITLATELRTPISSLRVSFDLLKDPEAVRNNPEESKRLVSNIERSIARLERQASDLLEVGYINTGSLSLVTQPINLSEPILASIDISRSTAALRQVAIELEMEPDIPQVIADGFRLTQVMTHLLSNAIKFAPVGESVVISISTGRAEKSGLYEENSAQSTNGEPDSVIVTVTDHGPGIREAHFEHIFEPFYRITGEGIEGGAGVGLGLPIVKGLVELHSGKVWVRSTPRETTEFGFSIPMV